MDGNSSKLARLSKHQAAIYRILSSGGKYSAADLSVMTHYSDPRSHIRDLRDKGVIIRDEWRKSDGGRYKVYFLDTSTGKNA